MFGYILINKSELKFREFDVYQSYYCGLCRTLKRKYGNFSRLSVNYDMTFLAVLLSGLYEPKFQCSRKRCACHPMSVKTERSSEILDYCADMNLYFMYLKCMDDWKDDKNAARLAFAKGVENKVHKIESAYPIKCDNIRQAMDSLDEYEKMGIYDLDKTAGAFGKVMEEVFDYRHDEWTQNLRSMAFYLGKFIYIMDAYEDIEKDIKNNEFNPLLKIYREEDFEENIFALMKMMMAECCREFEILPIVENIEILRNILYSGVWTKYNIIRAKKQKNQGDANESI